MFLSKSSTSGYLAIEHKIVLAILYIKNNKYYIIFYDKYKNI